MVSLPLTPVRSSRVARALHRAALVSRVEIGHGDSGQTPRQITATVMGPLQSVGGSWPIDARRNQCLTHTQQSGRHPTTLLNYI